MVARYTEPTKPDAKAPVAHVIQLQHGVSPG
jgi:hypothetical protein